MHEHYAQFLQQGFVSSQQEFLQPSIQHFQTQLPHRDWILPPEETLCMDQPVQILSL